MARFEFCDTPLPGLRLVKRSPMEDGRGFFARFYCADEFRAAGVSKPIAQINHSLTLRKGVVRGLHFQRPPNSEIKFVSCLSGAVFDVAVDLRPESPSFLRWHGEVLSAENYRGLLIPEGYAHGFQTLTENCELLYLHTAPFHSESEGAVNVIDPILAIHWPLDISELSDRDRAHPLIDIDYPGIRL
jgi:dTDP-4-dehydrorhamnose 3,5-epimerase